MYQQLQRSVAVAALLACTACSHPHDAALDVNCNRHTDIQCANKTLENTDTQLMATYQRVADTQEEEGVKRLALSQRNWFKFRGSYAEFVSMREVNPQQAQLQLLNQKIDSALLRIHELNGLQK